MNVIMAGTRTITDPALLEQAVIDSGYEVEIVFCGCADGVDKMAGHCHDTLLNLWIKSDDCEKADWGMEHCWACRHNIPVDHFPAIVSLKRRSASSRPAASMFRSTVTFLGAIFTPSSRPSRLAQPVSAYATRQIG